jgi:hypothetical protein
MEKIAYCGHHCAYCPFTSCPGCRSDNACCSYATLFDDKICPNVKCCKDKGLDGCYECQGLEDCNFGFYSTEERVAKAAALFIQKHGKNKYNIALRNAISDGIKYPNQFNEIIDIHKMIKLLEKYNK